MRQLLLFLLVILLVLLVSVNPREIRITNRCKFSIWIAHTPNNKYNRLPIGVPRIDASKSFTVQIPDTEWGGRFWPKTGCDGTGQNCEIGQAVAPCPAGGCQVPADTKVEYFFPAHGAPGESWYDISLVDGYSLPATILPSSQGGSCVRTNCAVSLDDCPTETVVGGLRNAKNGRTIQCMSPCKKWNWPKPIGLGNKEKDADGLMLCCPTPPVSSPQCRNGQVVKTNYVKLVRRVCPTAYSFAYDDLGGLHKCPSTADYAVTIC